MEDLKCPYCIHCDAPVDRIDYSAKLETSEVKGGTVITYVEVSAYCRECGMELYVPEINDMNKLSRDNAYAAAMKRHRAKGKWLSSTIPCENFVCSECGGACWYYDYQQTLGKSRFCPNCGADMREEVNDER